MICTRQVCLFLLLVNDTCTKLVYKTTFTALSHTCNSLVQSGISRVHILAAPHYTCKGPGRQKPEFYQQTSLYIIQIWYICLCTTSYHFLR